MPVTAISLAMQLKEIFKSGLRLSIWMVREKEEHSSLLFIENIVNLQLNSELII